VKGSSRKDEARNRDRREQRDSKGYPGIVFWLDLLGWEKGIGLKASWDLFLVRYFVRSSSSQIPSSLFSKGEKKDSFLAVQTSATVGHRAGEARERNSVSNNMINMFIL
jgi:hypothetical protein